MSYSLSGSDASLLSIDENNGELTFKALPDYETKITYLLTVTATDGVYPTDQNISILVTDIDDTAPVFTSPSKYTVEENELSIATITATDVDSESITYSVVGSDSSFVSIGSSSGVLVFNTAPDYETKNEFNFVVEASDGVNIGYLGVLIEILDIEDAAPVFTSPSSFTVNENTFEIGVISAIDSDSEIIRYSLGSDQGYIDNRISVDAISGNLSFITPADYEQEQQFNFVVEASDGLNSTSQAITVLINDLNEPPVVTEWRNNNFELIGSPEFSVEENSTGYFGTFRPSDPEGEEMVFSITDGFYISGYDKMYFSSTPDYERQSQFSPVLSISDGEFTTEYPLSISVIDIDDNNSQSSHRVEFFS